MQCVSNNTYHICASGFGNYSFRLYEIMAAGRIPVFINTDCELPFEGIINWKKQTVWIEEDDAKYTGQAILDFHQSLHPDDYIEIQMKNKMIYNKYLTNTGFIENLQLALSR